MDPQSFLFVLLMIAIGGLAAYTADILGYKIGKKRLSIKRIRPKYVARISVVIAGMVIPIITMLFLYFASSTFRTWITRGSEIVRDLEQKSKEVNKVNSQLVEGERKNALLANDYKIKEDQFDKKKKEADEQEKKSKELNASVQTLNSQITGLNSNISSLKRDKETALGLLGPIKVKLEAFQKQLPEVQKSLGAALLAQKDAEAKVKDANSHYYETSSKNLELTNANLELQTKNKELLTASENLKNVIDAINKDLESLKTQKSVAETDTKKALADLEIAKNAVTEVTLQAKAIYRQIEFRFRTESISYLRGEELARAPVGQGLNNTDAVSAYRALLRRVKSLAKDHGSVPDPSAGFDGTAGMLLTKDGRELSEEEVEAYWVGEIRRARAESILIASSAVNHFGSDPIKLEIVILPNPIVFRKGEIVTESKIDGRTSEMVILDGIREFLQTFVNTKARQRKMIPIQSRNGVSYGEFGQDQLLRAVALVRAVPRLSRLVAVARKDMRAGDQLDIDIEVR